MNGKTKKLIHWALTGLVAFILVGSAVAKLTNGAQAAEIAKGVGGPQNVVILGILELIIAAIWIYPRTGILGTLLAASYMGGAIAVHFVNNQPILIPVIIQMVIWLTAAYRFPELTKRIIY
ncbi:DoxX family protein [Polluticaenibacter yanchengensis]|uniref:DoxX family protein n=1 Tax=Polluticaenibacter yanchengensis TaxID=3014562 RepID=A0ABT4UNE4_9BACT|nr:DoxX family protein [Chitinophagaceae bacterium LY-5]